MFDYLECDPDRTFYERIPGPLDYRRKQTVNLNIRLNFTKFFIFVFSSLFVEKMIHRAKENCAPVILCSLMS